MHRPLTSFSPPAEAVCRGVATVIPNSFLGARRESWVLGEDQCSRPSRGMLCGVYRGTTSPHTPQGIVLWGLQRYYLSPHIPRDCAVGFTEVLPLPTHPKGLCCGVYRGTTSPHTPPTPHHHNGDDYYHYHHHHFHYCFYSYYFHEY